MNILFICGREPSYARNRILLNSLKYNKYNIIKCTSSSKNTIKRSIEVLLKFLKNKNKADIIFVGFLGHHLVPIIKFFTKKPIIFDAFISIYDTLIYDRKKLKKNSLASKLVYSLEKKACDYSNKIILDTNQHISYFVKTFKINKKKLYKIPVGAEEDIFYPRKGGKNKKFTVFFYGYFLNLHGIHYIIKAANILKKENIQFIITGKGQTYKKCIKLYKSFKIKNIIFKKETSIKEISNNIAKCDIGLGIFGKTNKTRRVIPNKVYQILAMKKPLITAKTPASKELLTNHKDVLFCKPKNSEDLAKKILELKNNKSLSKKIAENGYKTFKKQSSLPIISKILKKIIEN